jgi:lysophospholipase L1-like esterase
MGGSGRRVLRVGIASVIALAWTIGLSGTAQAAPAYTALGDSFTSGVGTRVYAYDTSSCKRSNYAYPVLDAQRLGLTLTFAACSGAKVPDVLNQLGSLNADTAYVTVMVGGNDAGFAPVITQCAKPAPYTCTAQLDNAEAYIRNTLPGALDDLYDRIRSRASSAKVVVVGYPRLFMGEDCNAGTFFSPSEMSRLNALADLLNSTFAARAGAHSFGFANPTQAFVGHAVCDSPEWINGLSNPIGESYHPNTRGQAGYADLVAGALGS